MCIWMIPAYARLDLRTYALSVVLRMCAFGFAQMRAVGLHLDLRIRAFGFTHVRIWICAYARLDLRIICMRLLFGFKRLTSVLISAYAPLDARMCAFGFAHIRIWICACELLFGFGFGFAHRRICAFGFPHVRVWICIWI